MSFKSASLKSRTEALHEGYLDHLKQGPLVGIDAFVQEVDSWITKDEFHQDSKTVTNTPLLISGDSGCGKSSFIAKWIEFHTRSHKKDNDYLLVHFSKLSPSDSAYFITLYRLYNEIRKAYNIPQKVEIIEDKLRIYFSLWLENADSRQQESQIMRKSIVVIIDGVDKYRDSNGKEEAPNWLPTNVPGSVKLIYTCDNDTRAFHHLLQKSGYHLHLQPIDLNKRKEMINQYINALDEELFQKYQPTIAELRLQIAHECCGNPLFMKLLLNFTMPKEENIHPFRYDNICEVNTKEKLFEKIIEFNDTYNFKEGALLNVLAQIALSRTGLSEDELSKIGKSHKIVSKILAVFKSCLVCYDGFYIFSNDIYRKVILSRYVPLPKHFHTEIIEILDKESITLRNSDELLYHLYESEDWMKLKDLLSDLEVFSIMFTPDYRLSLYFYWLKLERQHFDPVVEYNKSLEHFVVQYSPSNQDLFVLLLQFCRFFKEFADLETSDCCEFRHPHLKGYYELKEINLLNEIENLNGLFFPTQQPPLKDDENFAVENKGFRQQLKEKILNEPHELRFQRRKLEYYYYKRWLWIQFPWCGLDVYSDLSQIMKMFSSDNHAITCQNEYDMAISSLRILKEAKLKLSKRYQPLSKQATTKSMPKDSPKSMTVKAYAKAAGIFPEISQATLNNTFNALSLTDDISIPKSMSRHNSAGRIKHHKISSEYNFDLSFKDLTPSNILVKLGNKVSNYSNHEIQRKKKENYELQKYYNKLVNEVRMKKIKLEGLKSQIAKSEDKIKEGEEVKAKIASMQKKMATIFEKINRTEVECRRLEQVVTSCFKNPAKNDVWERGLEKGIENMKALIELEDVETKEYEHEIETLENQIDEFQLWYKDKVTFQSHTIDRVAEQFMLKTNVQETLQMGEKKRNEIISNSMLPKHEGYYKIKLRQRQSMLKKISRLKSILESKLGEFETLIERLQHVVNIHGPQDLTSVILQLERNEELYQSRFNVEEKLDELQGQKEALEAKLNFLQKKEEQQEDKHIRDNIEELNAAVMEAEKKLNHYIEANQRQEIVYITCKGTFEHIWRTLKIKENIEFTPENHMKIAQIVGDKAVEVINQIQNRVLTTSSNIQNSDLDLTPGLASSTMNNTEEHTPIHNDKSLDEPSPISNKRRKKQLIKPGNRKKL